MAGAPYRTPAPVDRTAEVPAGTADLSLVLLVLWIASVVRVFGAVARCEVAGAEVSTALLVVVLAPRPLWSSLGRFAARRTP